MQAQDVTLREQGVMVDVGRVCKRFEGRVHARAAVINHIDIKPLQSLGHLAGDIAKTKQPHSFTSQLKAQGTQRRWNPLPLRQTAVRQRQAAQDRQHQHQ